MKDELDRRSVLLAVAAMTTAAPALSMSRTQTEAKESDSRRAVADGYFVPSLLRDYSGKAMAWSMSITVVDQEFVMAIPVFKSKSKYSYIGDQPMGFSISKSSDGAHWQELEAFASPLEKGIPGFSIRWIGKEFILYVTEQNPSSKAHPVVVREYRSPDLKSWAFLGEDFATTDDHRWYRRRWDELIILPSGGRYYGYITSEPHRKVARDSLGMLESPDGLRWTPKRPPVIDWGDLPSQQMEVGFCERIGDRYYLGMGARCYLGSLGYSMMTFIGKSPTGPFRPDRDAFRLCGTTSRDVTWLGKTVHWKDQILFYTWVTRRSGLEGWTSCPMKQLRADDQGHLRLHWWGGNEKFKLVPAQVEWRSAEFVHPAIPYRDEMFGLAFGSQNGFSMQCGPDGAVALLPTLFDFEKGVIIEGTLNAQEWAGPQVSERSHLQAASGGFFLEQSPGKGLLMQFETLGLTRTGSFEYAARPAFDANDMKSAAEFIRDRYGGPYLGLSRFDEEDVIGPFGYATPGGIRNGKTQRFRVMISSGIIETYLDDRFVQTYVTGPTSGRLGFFGKNGRVTFEDLSAWSM